MRTVTFAAVLVIAALAGISLASTPVRAPMRAPQPIAASALQAGPSAPAETLSLATTPRVPLLVISKGQFSAPVLPESHVGYPGEFGDGFRRQVLPAVRRARTLIHENATLDPWVDWPHWWRSCLDERPELTNFNARLTSRIVANYRHSKWEELLRNFQELPGASAEAQFSTFIGSRSLLVNYLELEMRVRPMLERELAIQHSSDPKLTVQEYFADFGAVARIPRRIRGLERESIETLDDFAWALCSLEPHLARQMLTRSIEEFDTLPQVVRRRQPGAWFRAIETGFSALEVQLGLASPASERALAPLFGAGGRMKSEAVEQLLPELANGPAGDLLFLGLRNQRWAERIEEHARAGRTGLFYVLGAFHLFDYEHFDGLLTLLETRGFTIKVVRSDGRMTPLKRRVSGTSPPAAPSSSPRSTGTHR